VYTEDVAATVDMNLVMNSSGEFIELQASAKKRRSLNAAADLLALGKLGISQLLVGNKKPSNNFRQCHRKSHAPAARPPRRGRTRLPQIFGGTMT